MTRRLFATTIAVFLGLAVIPAQGPQNATAAINWNLIMFPTNRSAPMDQQRKDPVKLFDNLYSVGVQTVCAFLIPTNAGLVLVDTTYPETADLLLENIRKAGFDPATIRYIFSTHAATDHFGAAGRIKLVAPGSRVGMPLADWEEAEQLMSRLPAGSPLLPIKRELVLTDGQTLKVGETTFKFYVLPGRTPGSLAIEYRRSRRVAELSRSSQRRVRDAATAVGRRVLEEHCAAEDARSVSSVAAESSVDGSPTGSAGH